MTQPSDQNDFIQPEQSNRSSRSTVWILVGVGAGCGCLLLPIIIGIIAAIALPRFLSSASKAKQMEAKTYVSKAKQMEAKTYVGLLMKAQQEYYLKQHTFSPSIAELRVAVNSETHNYRYQIVPQTGNTKSVAIAASSKEPSLKSYTGAVFALKKGKDFTTVAGVCETDRATTTPPNIPLSPQDEFSRIECPAGSHLLQP